MYSIMMDYMLTRFNNYDIQRFNSGEDCLKQMHLNPEILVLDYMLPGMDGLQVLKEIKFISPNTSVIVLSSQQNKEIAKEILALGINQYLVKDENALKNLEFAIDKIIAKNEVIKITLQQKESLLFWVHSIFILVIIFYAIISYKWMN